MKKKIVFDALFSVFFIVTTEAQTWSALGVGIDSGMYHSVWALASYKGEIYAGGYFTSAVVFLPTILLNGTVLHGQLWVQDTEE